MKEQLIYQAVEQALKEVKKAAPVIKRLRGIHSHEAFFRPAIVMR